MNNIFAPIEKYEKMDSGVIMISGIASSEALDNQNEVVKSDAIKNALPDYLAIGGTGALREMHQSKAAGSVFKAEVMEDGRTLIEAKVVDTEACKKIEGGVYKGFSIGGKVLKKEGNIITKLKLTEISLVDRPCNPEALFDIYKCDDDSVKPEKTIKSKIIEAFHDSVAKDFAGETIKSDNPYTLSMGLNSIAALSAIIQSLICLKENIEIEAEIEEDKSKLPKDLTIAIKNLYDILARMSSEELEEFNNYDKEIKMSDNNEDLEKAVESVDPNSFTSQQPEAFSEVKSEVDGQQAQQTHPKELNDMFSAVDAIKRKLIDKGYITDNKIIDTTEIKWGEKSEQPDDLTKSMSELQKELSKISERLEKLEAQPEPAKAILKSVAGSAISKSSDASGSDTELKKVDREKFSHIPMDEKEFAAIDIIKTIQTSRI